MSSSVSAATSSVDAGLPAAPAPVGPLVSVVALCLGGLAASLTQTMVIPIQGELPLLLATDAADSSWVITITLLAAAVSMPIAGRLADLFGKQRVLVVTSSILVAGSVTCALAGSLAPMLVGRALQGLAMGFIPVGISLMREITPPHLTSTAIASMSATLGVGGAIALPLGAWIADVGDWHIMFWVATGVAALVVVAVVLLVPHVHDANPGRVDVVGAVWLAAGLVATLVGVTKGSAWGWTSAATLGCIAGGLLGLVAWGWYELRHDDPLVDLRTSAQLPVLLTNIAAVAVGFGMMAQAVVVPQLLQLPEATGYGLGQTIFAAGLVMAPGGLMMLLFAPVSSRLIGTVGPKTTLVVAAVVLGVGYLVGLGLMGSVWQLMLASCIASVGVAIGYAAMPTLILDAVPMHEAGSAVGVNALMRSIGTTLAAAVMATVLTSSTTPFGGVALPDETAFRVCFLIGAVAALVGAGIAATIPVRRTREAAAQPGVPVPETARAR